MALERRPDIVGVDLEATPDNGLIGPAEDPQEPLGISRAMSVVRIHGVSGPSHPP